MQAITRPALLFALTALALAPTGASTQTPATALPPAAPVTPPATMRWPDLLERPRPTGAMTIAYGSDPLQVGDLWLPSQRGPGPTPVVLMIHGGCWQTDIADRRIMDWIAADLAGQGIAVWNIDYRGVDRPGGAYPGIFADVAAATDHLRVIAPLHRLDTRRIVALGHSAGGHLALWTAARRHLPASSALKGGDPLPIASVIATGALPDPEAAVRLENNSCTASAMPRLVGPASASRRDVLADTSVARLLPLGVRQTLVNASLDRIAPPLLAADYRFRAAMLGEDVRLVEVPGEGHVELIAPGTAAWRATVDLIRSELGLTGR